MYARRPVRRPSNVRGARARRSYTYVRRVGENITRFFYGDGNGRGHGSDVTKKRAGPVLPKPENFIRWKNIRVEKKKKTRQRRRKAARAFGKRPKINVFFFFITTQRWWIAWIARDIYNLSVRRFIAVTRFSIILIYNLTFFSNPRVIMLRRRTQRKRYFRDETTKRKIV